MLNLTDAVAVGTGASRGVGRGTALSLSDAVATDGSLVGDVRLERPRARDSGECVSRAVAARTADPEMMKKSGRVLVTDALAREYDFTDTDGTQPPPFELEMETL